MKKIIHKSVSALVIEVFKTSVERGFRGIDFCLTANQETRSFMKCMK